MQKVIVDYLVRVTTDAAKGKGAWAGIAGEAAKAGAAVSLVATGFAAAGAAAVAMANDVTGAVDRINTMAQNSGLAAETIQGLEIAAAAAGKSIENILPKDLAKRIYEVSQGTGEAKEAFAVLDVAVKESDGTLRSSDDVLRDLINSLSGIKDPTLRAALAQKALGESANELSQVFADSGDLDAYVRLANYYGLDVGPQAQRSTSEWQKAMAVFWLSVDHARAATQPLIDDMARMVLGFAAIGIVATDAATAIREGRNPLEAAGKSWDTLRARLERFGDEMARVNQETLDFKETSEGAQDAMLEALGMPLQSETGVRGKPAKKTSDATAKAAEKEAARAAAEESARVLRMQLNTAVVDGSKVWVPALIDGIAETTRTQMDELDAIFAGILASMEAAVAADRQATMDQFGANLSVMGAAFAVVPELVGVLRGATSMVADVTDALVSLPEDLIALPDAVSALADVIAELPVALVEAAPDIALAILSAMTQLALLNVDIIATALTALFDALPGRIAESIADALRDLVANLNPFDGDGNFLFGAAEKAIANLPFFDTGGDVTRTGLAVVHEGERVLTAAERAALMGGAGGMGASVYVSNPDPAATARAVARALGPGGQRIRMGV